MAEQRKKYDRIFKENAVKVSYEKDTIKECADELGILPCILTRWRAEYQKFGSGSFQGSGYAKFHPDNRSTFELEKKYKESILKFDILKNATPHLYQGDLIIYQFIKDNEKKYSIAKMCKVLEVGIGRYLRWKKHGMPEKQKYMFLLKKDITSIFFKFKKHCGKRQITSELHNLGYKITDRQVSFYMKQLGLKRVLKRKFKATTDSSHNYYTAPNILNQNFSIDAPSKVWVSDITYIQTSRGFLYLTIIMDLFDRKIIGWSLGCRLFTATTTLPALEMAVKNRKVSKGLLFHSDRGVQYANKAFTKKLTSFEFIPSMSRKGSSIDNAVSESFFNSLKRELIHRKSTLISQKLMKAEIIDFIENWYNKKRMHSALDYKTIEQFNANNNLSMPE
ncbi:IS3 family transposase [Flavobacterium sp. 245]|uniref:IS3 family transposase n=1 Tax=Flavobacterium sp. 245 TaxID=2512115 RepID=UPI00105F0F08|nr:IS3 family transposase [Flavobacterium sp. 245]TDO97099.1 transposase InsO family protein [Flavobacterium sp. 245]